MDEALGQYAHRLLVLYRPFDDLVIDIRNVAHVGHIQPARAQPTTHHVKHHHHAGMPQMAVVIHRHPAHVHIDLARRDGDKILFTACQRIINFHGCGFVRELSADRGATSGEIAMFW